MGNLYIADNDIKVSKSNFVIYSNEELNYLGKTNKIKMKDLIVILQKKRNVIDALAYEILNAINIYTFMTSRQITEYLNNNLNIDIEQSKVSKKLEIFSSYSIISKYNFISSENEDGTNMKVYTLDQNGSILLKAQGFKCNWKLTDLLNTNQVKAYLIRNQYLLKLKKEYSNVKNLKIKNLKNGIGAIYSLKDAAHIIIPVRRYSDFKEKLLETYDKLLSDYDYLSITDVTRRTILIGEDVNHIYEIFRLLREHELLTEDTYYITDLKLYDTPLNKSCVRFGVKKDADNVKVIMPDAELDEFTI